MDVGILSPPSPSALADSSVLRDARLLNSDIGRHSVQCNFSSRLAGRFYQNGSLERHTLRNSRLVEMQLKKRRLEKELQLEERRVGLLEERLGETERARDDAHGIIGTIERGTVRFQAFVRRRQALRLFREMRRESRTRRAIAGFFQRRYRGWKGRLRAASRRKLLRRKRRADSATIIQASLRRSSLRVAYRDLLSERGRLSNRSAEIIQTMLRGKISRDLYLKEVGRRHDAAITIQQLWRGAAVRIMAEKLRQEISRKRIQSIRPKRVPLHLRKYSTYGASNLRGGEANNDSTKNKRDARMRRRSSDAMIVMNSGRLSSLAHLQSSSASVGNDSDENDSIGTATTSLTNAIGNSQNRRRSLCHRTRANNNRPPSWPSPRKVSAPPPDAACKDKVYNPRRASLERRQTVAGGSIQKWSRRNNGSRQPHLETHEDSDLKEDSTAASPLREERQKSGGFDNTDPSSPERRKNDPAGISAGRSDALESSQTTITPPTQREDAAKTPATVSREASLIVHEGLKKIVMSHCIVHSVFEDEFSEHEDDLE